MILLQIARSRINGANINDVYQPTAYWYPLMKFVDHCKDVSIPNVADIEENISSYVITFYQFLIANYIHEQPKGVFRNSIIVNFRRIALVIFQKITTKIALNKTEKVLAKTKQKLDLRKSYLVYFVKTKIYCPQFKYLSLNSISFIQKQVLSSY